MAAPESPHRQTHLRRIGTVVPGVLLGFWVTTTLPVLPALVISALLLAATSALAPRLRDPVQWWGMLSLACGGLFGAAALLTRDHFDPSLAHHTVNPTHAVLLLAVAGVVAGRTLARNIPEESQAAPKDLLRSASGMTTGVFAAFVTLTYLVSGLEEARIQASQLSTGLTILVFSLACPGWITHLLTEKRIIKPRR